MNLYNGSILTLFALLVAFAAAEELSENEKIVIAIRTLIRIVEPLTPAQDRAIDQSINNLGLDEVVDEIAVNATVPVARMLRGNDDRMLCATALNCLNFPSHYTHCYIHGTGWVKKCSRGLTMHQELSHDEVAVLSEKDRRRHLEVEVLCQEAKEQVASAIGEAESEGRVPIPPDSEIAEQCFYEIVTIP